MTDETSKGPPKLPRPPSLTPPSSDPQRRVYALPQEMVDRIVEFQKEKGYTSEVEAVRRLLDEALMSRDNLEKIINRYLSKLGNLKVTSEAAKDVLVGHPLVKSITFGDDDVQFTLKSGLGARITESGVVYIMGPDTRGWKWEPGDVPYAAGKLDDIPF